MAFVAKLKRCSHGAATRYPRKIMRSAGYVPFEIYSYAAGHTDEKQFAGYEDAIGYLWINKASLVGSGGSATTLTDGTSKITIS
jgi:hypothetical protein